MVFPTAVTNIDHHPRNHAGLRRRKARRLSPPTGWARAERRDLVWRYDRTASISKLLSQAGRFALSMKGSRPPEPASVPTGVSRLRGFL